MPKATHVGHCQVCGSKQKLPGGVLSKHGYTRRFHFFEGVCAGAHYLPFEQDISLIQGMIDSQRARAKQVREQAAAERLMDDPNDVWYHMYLIDLRGRGGYEWRKTRLRQESQYNIRYEEPPNGRSREPHWERVHAGTSYELEGVARECNEGHAKHLDKLAASLDDYCQWQEVRIKDWKPTPLDPV